MRKPDHAYPTGDPLCTTAIHATHGTANRTSFIRRVAVGIRLIRTSDTAQSESTDTDPTSDLLDLNTAGLEELQTLKGIGPVTAQRILDYRMQFGRFDNVDQLMEVKGIGSKTLAKFRDQVCVR